ncbi:putative disease resistance protein RGA1 isoform X2 [Triticum aestivum]|uniref:putative disease resistance protein RGA1 isoform X2 n=1 Tax=Triticum aestivum TaxID=4565 RepID=UPI001D0203C8|nr:putative disease resistance protein RGA1 isoform X2 [Triticum aestivum]
MATRAIVQRACAKLRSAIRLEAVVHLNFARDLRDMLEVLVAIQTMLEDAEMQLFRDGSTASYLQLAMTRMLPRLAIMKNAMATQVQETKKIVMWVLECSRELSEYTEENTIMFHQIIEERKTGPVFEEAMVLGRGSDKERIIAALLSTEPNITQENITILPIFGLLGSGKTTMAQMVFNDTHSLQGYDFRVWIHVSPQFDFHTIGNSIISHVSGRGQEEINHSSSDVEGMESMMNRLQKLLSGKKVLLVLDDLWEEDPIQLRRLKSMLTSLGDKMDVLVTTCNQAIARRICTVEPYMLNRLSDDTCWQIIKKSIRFKVGEEELEKIGREIASKCRGVPSAARDYAGMLDCYSRDARLWWKKTMELNICFSVMNYGSAFSLVLSTFELSYKSMPPSLRLCFAYCCLIFPASHSMVKDDLVHHWIALHLIEPSEILSATKIAEEYITRLQDLSFLQTAELDNVSGKDEKGAILFTIHDPVHDLMVWFLGNSSYRLATNPHGKIDDTYDKYLRALCCVGCSKVEFKDDSFSRKKCLRVLELKESSVQKLPHSICQLRYLGYLKISEFTGLVTLPDSFGQLKNLFHIDLSGCSRLAALPESFGDLINLSHVNLSRCHGLAGLPEPLQNLGKLVHLDLSFWSCFEEIGKNLGGLTTLEHLNLSNPCCHLDHRSHLKGLKGLKDGLCKLTKLRYLNLSACLNPIFYYHQSQEDSLKYLGECVRNLSSLEHLDLSHHTFLFGLPASLGELNNLKTLNLSGCIRLKMVGEMKSLTFTNLRMCRGLESCQFVVRIIDDDDVYSSSNIVQLEVVNCQELQISCLENVRSRVEAQRIKMAEKQKIKKLKLSWTLDSLRSVEDSALLGELLPPPNLQCLEVNGYAGTCLPEYLGELTSLQELKIVCCKHLNSLPDRMQKLTSLKDLCIFDCPELEKWCQLEENKKMLAHIPNKNYEEPASTSRQEIEEDDRSGDEVEAV